MSTSVVEAVSSRSIAARKDAGVEDLLYAPATASCQARHVLGALGVSGERLVTLLGGQRLP